MLTSAKEYTKWSHFIWAQNFGSNNQISRAANPNLCFARELLDFSLSHKFLFRRTIEPPRDDWFPSEVCGSRVDNLDYLPFAGESRWHELAAAFLFFLSNPGIYPHLVWLQIELPTVHKVPICKFGHFRTPTN